MRERGAPQVMPVLQVGQHRRPVDGACVMEYVSMLAGERFSDDPTCVDAPLAALARAVNDRLSEGARQQLLSRVVDLIGTSSVEDDVRLRAGAAVIEAAAPALTSSGDAFFISVTVLGLEQAAVGMGTDLSTSRCRVLAAAERAGGHEAVERARQFVAGAPFQARHYVRRGLPAAMSGLACRVAGDDARADAALLSLLDSALAVYRSWPAPDAHALVRCEGQAAPGQSTASRAETSTRALATRRRFIGMPLTNWSTMLSAGRKSVAWTREEKT
jgi:hypothetical protein